MVLKKTLVCLLFTGAAGSAQEHKVHPHILEAIAVVQPSAGSGVSGVVRFTQEDTGIRVVAQINGLTPGNHGFHIHQRGDCSAADATSAGGHFNPGGHDHGGPDSGKRHVGDLGNILADETGTARVDFIDPVLTFVGQNSIIGRAVIVHANPDDLASQPTGNAGGRVACGVIGIAGESE